MHTTIKLTPLEIKIRDIYNAGSTDAIVIARKLRNANSSVKISNARRNQIQFIIDGLAEINEITKR